MSFSGAWSLGGSGGGGGISSTSWGSGGGGSTSGSGMWGGSGGGSTGTWSLGPAPTTTSTSTGSYATVPGTSYYGYAAPGAYVLPGAGLFAGPFGEGGPYTPFDYPLMHELRPGQRLEDLNPQNGVAGRSLLPILAVGIIAALLLKDR